MEFALPRLAGNRLDAAHHPADVEHAVARLLGPHRLLLAGRSPLDAELYETTLQDGGLVELSYGRAARVEFGGPRAPFLFRLTLAGACELHAGHEHAAVARGGLSVSSPSQPSRLETSDDCRSLLLHIDRTALEAKLAQLLPATPSAPLRFALAIEADHPGATLVHDTLGYLCRLRALASPTPSSVVPRAAPPAPPPADATLFGQDLTQWLMTVLLTQLPHSHSAALAREATRTPLPAHVRRARDHVDAHLDTPLTLAVLARAAGVSPRTLQNGFARFLGLSPAAYVRERRLTAVHQLLSQPGGMSVSAALLACGVQSFGHFGAAYTRRFGHAPSATRGRVR